MINSSHENRPDRWGHFRREVFAFDEFTRISLENTLLWKVSSELFKVICIFETFEDIWRS